MASFHRHKYTSSDDRLTNGANGIHNASITLLSSYKCLQTDDKPGSQLSFSRKTFEKEACCAVFRQTETDRYANGAARRRVKPEARSKMTEENRQPSHEPACNSHRLERELPKIFQRHRHSQYSGKTAILRYMHSSSLFRVSYTSHITSHVLGRCSVSAILRLSRSSSLALL